MGGGGGGYGGGGRGGPPPPLSYMQDNISTTQASYLIHSYLYSTELMYE